MVGINGWDESSPVAELGKKASVDKEEKPQAQATAGVVRRVAEKPNQWHHRSGALRRIPSPAEEESFRAIFQFRDRN